MDEFNEIYFNGVALFRFSTFYCHKLEQRETHDPVDPEAILISKAITT